MEWDIQSAYRDLTADPIMNGVITVTGSLEPLPRRDLYTSLLSSIISQQLSTKAASTIWSRFMELVQHNPKPLTISNLSIDKLRAVGISYQKAGYLTAVADFAIAGKLKESSIEKMPDDELVEYLTQIKGVGRWTSEMILIFSLNRPDVFPVDDLGVRQSVLSLYGMEDHGKNTSEELKFLSCQWRPYRSLVSRHLWKLRDTNP
jgi:DNA-3-methyladenine glycosylase II